MPPMFAMMKNLLKEKEAPTGSVRLADLHVGCTVGFGFMPQKNISGRRMHVAEVNSYLFDNDNFVAFRLESENTEVNLIIADDGNPEGTYLALSRRLKERFFAPLFSTALPENWFDVEEGSEIDVATGVLGAPQGWLATNYRLAMKTHGRLLDGDFRLRKPAGRLQLSRPFDYVLLVDENNSHALEAEKYEDGSLIVYATIYRPVTDIGEMTLPPRQSRNLPLMSEKEMFATFAASTEAAPDLTTEIKAQAEDAPLKHISPVIRTEIKTEPMFEAKLEPRPDLKLQPPQIDRIVLNAAPPPLRPVLNTSKVDVIPHIPPVAAAAASAMTSVSSLSSAPLVHGKFGRIQPAIQDNNAAPRDMLACETKLAGRIIDEAQRNHMPLSELIRKVIDLPAKIQEEVHIPFKLEPAEYAELARRYNLSASDHEAVRERILEEIRLFVGMK